MKLKELIESTQDLPTIPSVAIQINEEIKKKSLTAKSLGAIIERDQSLTSKLLRLANSAYYGLPRQIETPQKAITILGLDTIQSIAMTLSIFQLFTSDSEPVIDLEGLWFHSLGTAVAAKEVISITQKESGEKAFICGIIHDIGKILIIHNLPQQMNEIMTIMGNSDTPILAAEEEILGYNHPKAGAMLADFWNFPLDFVKSIQHHHHPYLPKNKDELNEAALVNAIYVGNTIAKAISLGKSTDQAVGKIRKETMEFLQIPGQELNTLLAEIKKKFTDFVQTIHQSTR
ncbi:HDOD domain-containing protein [Thermodesulfobacteriota bacterium]